MELGQAQALEEIINAGYIPVAGRIRQIPFAVAVEVGLNPKNLVETASFLQGQLVSGIQQMYTKEDGTPMWEKPSDLDNLLGNLDFNFVRVALPTDKPAPLTFLREAGMDPSEDEPEMEIEYKVAVQIIDNGSDIPDAIKGFMLTVNESGRIGGEGKQQPAVMILESFPESTSGSVSALEETRTMRATLERQIMSTLNTENSMNPSETLNVQAGTSIFIRNFLYGSQLGGWRGRRRPSEEFPSIPGRHKQKGFFNSTPAWIGWMGRLEAQNPNITMRPQDTLDWNRN